MGVKLPVSAGGREVFTVVDDDVAALLTGRRISLGSHGYAQIFWAGRVEVLHRFVMSCTPRDGRIIDHIDRDKLNNIRANLRTVTASENNQNTVFANRPFRGAYRNRHGRFAAVVMKEGKRRTLGTFATREEAAERATQYRSEHFLSSR